MNNNIKSLIISIDGREEFHNKIRRKKNLFQNVISGIKKVGILKKEKNKMYPEISIATVITPENYQELYEFLNDLNSLPIDHVVFNHLRFLTKDQIYKQRAFINKHFGKEYAFFPNFSEVNIDDLNSDNNILRQQIKQIEQNKGNFNFTIDWARGYDFQLMMDYYTDNFNKYLKNMECTEIFNSISIDPYGDMYVQIII